MKKFLFIIALLCFFSIDGKAQDNIYASLPPDMMNCFLTTGSGEIANITGVDPVMGVSNSSTSTTATSSTSTNYEGLGVNSTGWVYTFDAFNPEILYSYNAGTTNTVTSSYNPTNGLSAYPYPSTPISYNSIPTQSYGNEIGIAVDQNDVAWVSFIGSDFKTYVTKFSTDASGGASNYSYVGYFTTTGGQLPIITDIAFDEANNLYVLGADFTVYFVSAAKLSSASGTIPLQTRWSLLDENGQPYDMTTMRA